MKLLLIIAMLIASLSFTGVVEAAHFCVGHDCQQEMATAQTDEPSGTSEAHCHDCCLHHGGHALVYGGTFYYPVPALTEFVTSTAPELMGHEPSGLLRPPRTA